MKALKPVPSRTIHRGVAHAFLVLIILCGCVQYVKKSIDDPSGNPVVRLEVRSTLQSSGDFVKSSGTGFFVTRNGYLVTNDHVVHPVLKEERCKTESIVVRYQPGAPDEVELAGVVEFSDPVADIAIVKVSGQRGVPILRLAQADTVKVAAPVRVQGYPLGGPYTETTGIVLATLPPEGRRATGIIFCTAGARPGNSGGPVLDNTDSVIGVAVAISNVELLRSYKRVQDSARNSLAQLSEALARKSAELKSKGDVGGFGSEMESMAQRGREALAESARESWILEEAVRNPTKTHVIDVAGLRRLLSGWRIDVDP